MNKRLFNLGLYTDSLRRTTLVGGLFTVLMCIQSLFVVFGSLIAVSDTADINFKIETVSLLRINPLVTLIPFIATPILIFVLFGFLNKRSNSDFWHSTPFSRQTLFIVFSLAVLTWVAIAIITSSAVSVVGFALMPKYFAIDFTSVLSVILSSFALTLLIAGAFTIAVSLTGTALNGIIVACLILALPQTLILYYNLLISNGALFPYYTISIFDTSLNLIFATIVNPFMFGTNVAEATSSYPAIIYTSVLGIVYFVAGGILFKLRKSETASYSSVNKYMQTLFRVIVSFVVCLIPIFLISDNIIENNNSIDSEFIFICTALYAVAIITYFLYELITTKSAKNMLKAIPSLAILLVSNVVMIVLINTGYKAEFSYTPTPQKVDCVRISLNGNRDTNNYYEKLLMKTDLYDVDLEKLLCDAYARTKASYQDDYLYKDNPKTILVGFGEGNRYKYRNVYLNEEEYQSFSKLIEENRQIKNIYNIDSIFEKAINIEVTHILSNPQIAELTDKETKKIIESYSAEIKQLPFEVLYQIIHNPYEHSFMENEIRKNYYSIGDIITSCNIDGQTYYIQLPITNKFEKTYNLLLSYIFERQSKLNFQNKALEHLISERDNYVELYNGKSLTQAEGYSMSDAEKINKFKAEIIKELGIQPTAHSRIAIVHSYNTVIFKVPDSADLTFLISNSSLID